jgi:acetyl-CoA acyltransferase
MREAVIVAALRTPVGRAPRGTLRDTRPDDMAAAVIRAILSSAPAVRPEEIEDVILGCAMPEAEQGMNVARIAALRAGLPMEVPAVTVNRFCASGLQAIAMAAERILSGFADIILAGGAETMSLVPIGGHRILPNPALVDQAPDTYLSMGLTAENLAVRYGISRAEQDEFALRSHRRALAAIAAGKFRAETVALDLPLAASLSGGSKNGSARFEIDEGPRADTTLKALANLKPAFHARGTVTAGNSSQMSDGAAMALVMSGERARAIGLKPLARFVAYATAGVPPEIMGIGPVAAIPKVLKLAGLKLEAMARIELNEAFAVQALSVVKELGLDPEKVNVNGGAIALGHPLGCTGAKLTATLLQELQRTKAEFGLVTMCIGGGMGAAGIFQRL